MDIEELREYCLSKKGCEETLPFGPDTLVFKVMGKAFLLTGLDVEELQFNVKCDPALAIELRERYECVLPCWTMNKKHWNTIIAKKASDKMMKEWIDHSYELRSE